VKKLLLLLIPTVVLAQPTSIHYSDVGNYLVDENGKRTVIEGHPNLTCYRRHGYLKGKFFKQRGSIIWLQATEWNRQHLIPPMYVEVPNPVCEVE